MKNKKPIYFVGPEGVGNAIDEIYRLDRIDVAAFEIAKLLQGEDKAFQSWAIGRAKEILGTGIKVNTMDEYKMARTRLRESEK